ncbi:MAG: TIGR03619 family F420-dependent LLM class oxidoreductase [Nocardioides sp.]|uniref:TIGR03619 family F420-dependent LLM class oxidoreductase n=1 Tax=Nocardioides sp. TaxID=35761 RepID=UPI0039E35779
MRFIVDYPIVVQGYDPALVTRAGMTRVVTAIERHGYDAVAFSEHPAPSARWIAAGGHESLHQMAALSFCAAATERIRLMPLLMVLPYHNPFLAAKALATVDLLSDGRVTLVAGTGYLRSEFLAMGIDIEERNEIFDEALEVIRGVWNEVPYHHSGSRFSARGLASLPLPAQPSGPPLLIGGNSRRARERAAWADGWSPILVPPEVAATSRTPGIASVAALAAAVRQVRERAVEVRGEGATVTVQVLTPQMRFIQAGGSVEEHRHHLGELAQAGVDAFVVRPPGDDVERTLDALAEYAALILASPGSACAPAEVGASPAQ